MVSVKHKKSFCNGLGNKTQNRKESFLAIKTSDLSTLRVKSLLLQGNEVFGENTVESSADLS